MDWKEFLKRLLLALLLALIQVLREYCDSRRPDK